MGWKPDLCLGANPMWISLWGTRRRTAVHEAKDVVLAGRTQESLLLVSLDWLNNVSSHRPAGGQMPVILTMNSTNCEDFEHFF